MNPTRRDLAWSLAAGALAPGAGRAQGAGAIVIAEGGAAGQAPPSSRAAFDEAIDQGADFLGAVLVASSDGALVVRPDNLLSETTDVAMRPQFADRRRTKTIGGAPVTGWFSEDFTLDELKSLGIGSTDRRAARGRGPGPTVLTFQDVIDIARAGSVRRARVVGVWAVLSRADYFASIDLALEPRLAQAIRSNGYNWPSAAMVVSATNAAALKSLAALTRVRLVQRLYPEGDARDGPPLALQDIHAYAAGIECDVIPQQDMRSPSEETHGAGLRLYARAMAVGNLIRERRGFWQALFEAGVDGVICDTPAEAMRGRNAATERLRRRG